MSILNAHTSPPRQGQTPSTSRSSTKLWWRREAHISCVFQKCGAWPRSGSVGSAHCVAPYKMTQELNHRKPSANRGAIAPNLPTRRHERLTTSDIKSLAHSKCRRRLRGASPSRHLLTVFGTVTDLFRLRTGRQSFQPTSSENICFQLSTCRFQLAPPIMVPDRINVGYLEFVWRKHRNP